MHDALRAFHTLNLIAFIALGVVALITWYRRRDRASGWAAAAFGSLAALEVLSLIPTHEHNIGEKIIARFEVVILVVFPYLLFRFTNAFRTPARALAWALAGLTAVLVVWACAIPRYPQPDEPRSAGFEAFVIVFLIHWTILSIAAATLLWRAGREQPTVARRRMQFLAFASAVLTLALILVLPTSNSDSGWALGTQLLGFAAVIAFLVGFAPPQVLRVLWRAPETERFQSAMASLLTFAETEEEVASRVLEPAAQMVGARAATIRNSDGTVVGAWKLPADGAPSRDAELVEAEAPGATITVWTTPEAPFFGEEELALLRALGAVTGLALDRVRLYQAEHEARLQLERANELKANFIALAAHELRTPVTTIHGFVTTLHHLGDRLDEEQRETVRHALLQQTERMARLVEQLLDLSRLDADAIEIVREPVNVRDHVEDIVRTVAADPEAVEVAVPENAVAAVDRNVLDRVIGNLITNAFRYGQPPVIVTAEKTARHLRISVEDRGGGVSPQFVPDLFERFSRSEGSRASAVGTGLGLAIARSYARAHGGDLVYEDAIPTGAKFRLVLPA
ncbi:MAG TPA: HAMP domain-containing sensor histidine kinase [Gaiellaceae bacterium]